MAVPERNLPMDVRRFNLTTRDKRDGIAVLLAFVALMLVANWIGVSLA